MVDTTIFGIDGNIVGIYANIGVALGTLVLAWFTWRSVQTSKETLESLKTQVDIAKQDFENKQTELEKPQILDQLQYVLNPLRFKIIAELRQIDEKLLFWNSLRHRESSHPPIRYSDQYYDNPNPSTPLGLIIYRIDIQNSNFSKMCHDRHKLSLEILEIVNGVYVEIKNQEFDKKINVLTKNRSDYISQPAGLDKFSEQALPTQCNIPFDTFISTIVDVGVARFLSQRIETPDSSSIIIQEFSDYEVEFKKFFNSEKFNKYADKFHFLLNELEQVDDRLFKNIDETKLSFQNRYHLNKDDYWKVNHL